MLHYNKCELTESFELVQKSSETGAVFQGDLSHQSNPDNLTRTNVSDCLNQRVISRSWSLQTI